MPETRENGPVLLRRLGLALQQARKEAKQTQAGVAAACRCSQDTISLIERGIQLPSEKQLNGMLLLYKPPVQEKYRILSLAESSRDAQRGWWDMFPDIFPAKLMRFFAYEYAATSICSYSATYVPGILQTPDYAKAFAAYYLADESTEYRRRFVQLRVERRQIFNHEDLHYHAVFTEAALRCEVGGPAAMKEQLKALAEVGRHPRLHLRMIPFTAGVAAIAAAPYTIMDFSGDEDPSILFAEMTKNGEIQAGVRAVEDARRQFDRSLADALSESETLTRVEKAMALL